MKIPKEIKGSKKLRNAKICKLWNDDIFLNAEKIGEMFHLTKRRVNQILYENRDFLKSDKEWEKTKRKRWLKQQIHKRGDSRKDSADLVEQLRVEEEGTKVEHSGEIKGGQKVVIIVQEKSGDQSQEGRLPTRVSVIPS